MRLRHGETVTIKRYGTNPHGESSLISQHTIRECHVTVRVSEEPLNLRTDTITTGTLYAPWGSDIRDTDRVEQVDGTIWDVVGKPKNISSPLTGWKAGQKVTLKHVSG